MADDLDNLPLDNDSETTKEPKKKRRKKRRKPKRQKKPKKVKIKKQGSSPAFLKILVRVLIVTFVVLLQVGISYTVVTRFLMSDSVEETETALAEEPAKEEVEISDEDEETLTGDEMQIPASEVDYSKLQGLVTLSDLVVNTAFSNGKRYFVTSLVLAVDDKKMVERVTEREPMIRDRLISLLSQKTYAWLGNFTNRETLRREILLTVKSVLECSEGIHVYFTKYVLQ